MMSHWFRELPESGDHPYVQKYEALLMEEDDLMRRLRKVREEIEEQDHCIMRLARLHWTTTEIASARSRMIALLAQRELAEMQAQDG